MNEEQQPEESIFTGAITTHDQHGLILTIEANEAALSFGDLLNLIADNWRGREDIGVSVGQQGAIRDPDDRVVGLWMITNG